MKKLCQCAPRPASSRRSPGYPQAFGIAAAFLAAACGGAVTDASDHPTADPTGGAPATYDPALQPDGSTVSPATTGTGGAGGALPTGSAGGGIPLAYDLTGGTGGGLIVIPQGGSGGEPPTTVVVPPAQGGTGGVFPTGSGGGGIAAPFDPVPVPDSGPKVTYPEAGVSDGVAPDVFVPLPPVIVGVPDSAGTAPWPFEASAPVSAEAGPPAAEGPCMGGCDATVD
jgi:hypothetical protein